MKVKLIAITKYLDGDGTPEELLEHAGRVCYRSQPQGNPGKFLQSRIREGHESLIEHASATFEISGISRACSHQLVRHRLASYSQESQRYCDTGEWEPVTPESIVKEYKEVIFQQLVDFTKQIYQELCDLGVPKEDARFVLPNATPTRIVVTMNFRSWRHFIKVRCDKHAQWEIRAVANEILQQLCEQAPSVFADLVEGEFVLKEETPPIHFEINTGSGSHHGSPTHLLHVVSKEEANVEERGGYIDWPEPDQTYGADDLPEREDGCFI